MYDVIVAGGGPAGLTAGLYAARAGMSVLVLEGYFSGGQMTTTFEIENYPSVLSIFGSDLAMNFEAHAKKAGAEIKYEHINKMDIKGTIKKVYTDSAEYEAKAVILAMGAKRRTLSVKGEAEFTGRGVSYCATCDGAFFRNKVTAVIGGGNSALEDSLYLSNICSKVYLIHRRDEFRGAYVLADKVRNNPKIELILNTLVDEFIGKDVLEKLAIHNSKTSEQKEIEVSGAFVTIGTKPQNDLIADSVNLTEDGHIITDEKGATNIEGVYAAGDIKKKPLYQIVTAAADGAVAANFAAEYISHKFDK